MFTPTFSQTHLGIWRTVHELCRHAPSRDLMSATSMVSSIILVSSAFPASGKASGTIAAMVLVDQELLVWKDWCPHIASLLLLFILPLVVLATVLFHDQQLALSPPGQSLSSG